MDGGNMFDGGRASGGDGNIGGDDPAALPEVNGAARWEDRSIELPFLLVLAIAIAGFIAALILYVEPH